MSQWYCHIGGQRYGPVDQSTLQQWLAEGRLKPSDQVWAEGMAQWAPAQSIEGLCPPDSVSPSPKPPESAVPPELRAQHRLSISSVAWMVILHYISLGIVPMVRLNLMHGKMPKNRPNDPSAGRAIGFFFIPFFNWYWMFFTYCRLCDRINEQREMRGLSRSVPKGLAIAMCVAICISVFIDRAIVVSPGLLQGWFLGVFIGIALLPWAILMPVFAGIVQAKVNELVRQTALESSE